MNPFRKIANSLMNWWKGETAPEVSDSTELTGGVMTLNSPSFLESMGLSRRRKTTSEVTYFTCLKMLSETLAKMPIKYYQRTDKGIIEAEQTDTSRLLTKRPNPFMTPTVFWNTVEINRNHYGNAYVYMRKKFIRKKYGGEVKILDLWVMQSNCVQIVVDDAGIFAGKGRLWYVYTDPTSGSRYVFDTSEVMHFKTSFSFDGVTGLPVQQILRDTISGASASQRYMNSFSIALGDTVLLISKSTGIRESHRIVKFYEYPLTKEKNKVELANTRLSFEEVQRTEQELS